MSNESQFEDDDQEVSLDNFGNPEIHDEDEGDGGAEESQAKAAAHGKEESKADDLSKLRAMVIEERHRNRTVLNETTALKNQINELLARQGSSAGEANAGGSDYAEDPIGYLKEKLDMLEGYFAQAEQENHAASSQQQALAELDAFVNASVRDFSEIHPDYQDAALYVLDKRVSEYKALGMGDNDIHSALSEDLVRFVSSARQNGQDPASLVYKIAGVYGFTSQPKPQTQKRQEPADKGQSIFDTLSGLQEKTARSQRLSGGMQEPEGDGDIIKRMIATDDNNEFDKLWDKFERESRAGGRR